ncbi:hypothetical protein NPIL_506931 [Nephila pilipes]|uniref:Uncharacterized protein n=1 Tax=Nephila pilipes TaxID=299642 RepID=A0A8X6I574_NEPPI|nr:hypothetical protein NPIL_506931 [Nephila pilipes]
MYISRYLGVQNQRCQERLDLDNECCPPGSSPSSPLVFKAPQKQTPLDDGRHSPNCYPDVDWNVDRLPDQQGQGRISR